MRFVPSSSLKPGMITGKDLYGFNNELMLSEDQILTDVEINRIRTLKFQGIYIKDELSKEAEVKSAINSRLKNSAVKTIKDLFSKADSNDENIVDYSGLKHMVDDIVDEISANDIATVNMIDLKVFDDYTYYHCVNVAVLSIIIGLAMGLNRKKLYYLGVGAMLHDIGKIFVPKEILAKNGKLTAEEFEIVKEHSKKGSEYLKTRYHIPFESNLAVLTHHEYYNGRGYPYNLKSEKIPELGRIITVADVYDALTSDRPYRKALPPSEAVEYIMGGSGSLFDPDIVRAFTKQVIPYPVGTIVNLSNGLCGIVIKVYPECSTRPKIKIIADNKSTDLYYDLYNDRNLLNVTIVGIAEM